MGQTARHAGAARLGIDIGVTTTSAVLSTADGVRLPLLFDGSPSMPSGVHIGPNTLLLTGAAGLAAAVHDPQGYVTSALTALTSDRRPVDGVDLLAAVLRRVADTARAAGATPQAVSLTVPPQWGPHRRQLITEAAIRAGLPTPDLIAAPVAVADHLAAVTAQPPPVGACVLVCDATPTSVQLSVLQRDPDAMNILATTTATPMPDGAGQAAENTVTSDRPAARVREVLQAADISPAQLAAVILAGSAARQPALADTLAAATGRTVLIPTDPALAAADGATRTPTTLDPATTAAPLRLAVRQLAWSALLAAAALAVLAQSLPDLPMSRLDGVLVWVSRPMQQLAAAGLLAALTALAVAHLAPATLLTGPHAARIDPTLIRRVYGSAAALGMAVAVLFGMAAGAYSEEIRNPYLWPPVLAALPTTAVTLTAALLAGRIPPPALPTWVSRARHPPAMPLLAAAGIMLMTYAVNTPPSFTGFRLIGHLGAAILGIATAATITQHRALRAISAGILALGAAAVYNYANIPVLILAYLTATTWWAATAITATDHAAFPTASTTLHAALENLTKPSPPPPTANESGHGPPHRTVRYFVGGSLVRSVCLVLADPALYCSARALRNCVTNASGRRLTLYSPDSEYSAILAPAAAEGTLELEFAVLATRFPGWNSGWRL